MPDDLHGLLKIFPPSMDFAPHLRKICAHMDFVYPSPNQIATKIYAFMKLFGSMNQNKVTSLVCLRFISTFRFRVSAVVTLRRNNAKTGLRIGVMTKAACLFPTLQHSNTPILQYSSTPVLQYSSTPVLQYSSNSGSRVSTAFNNPEITFY
jgi:hypothetical protein